ncbi:MAG: RDD family protein [Elusimicrobiaceae bacterium]|nr:RDD family protein [Elusimicrobiaceae bacterium]
MNTQAPYAGFFRRAAAFTIDAFFVSIPPLVICLFLWFLLANALSMFDDPQEKQFAIVGIYVLLFLLYQGIFLITYWLYFALFESGSKQATLGKRLLKIKVIDQQGNRLGFGRATGRAFARILSQLTLQIGFVMAGCTHRKRALHDMIAQTYVVDHAFQPGDELPDSPNHPVWLAVWCVVLSTLFIIGIIQNAATQEGALAVQEAAVQLQELAQTQKAPPTPTPDGTRYFRHADGYRALVGAGTGISLFLPRGSDEVCCEENEENSCANMGLPVCE